MRRPSGTAIITSTTWEDSGFDCDHCGGRILRRIDRETGLRDRVCLQCEQCSCQWTLERQPLRVGTTPACRAAQRDRVGAGETTGSPVSPWLAAVLALVLIVVLWRFGGGAMLRVVLPLLALVAAAAVGIRYGRWREWW